jgi:hypothetical protein
LQLLGQRLDRDGRVEFKNGAVVEVVEEVDLRVTWPGSAEHGYANQWAHDQLGRAYALAMEGAPPPEPVPAPRPKRQPPPRDWGPCPF